MIGSRQQAFVLNLDAPEAGLARVGGKGASLARLARAGLPVPAGFHVTTEAYRNFVEHAGLREEILAAVAGVDPDRPETSAEASRRIGALFARHDPSVHVAGPIRWSYAGLGDRDQPVAVRSSAPDEDLADESSAGQFGTLLGVRGEAAVLDAVRECWASLWSARAIAYRADNGVDHAEASIAVTVQAMVPADSAGLMYTVAPVSGAADQLVINAAWGLGDAVTGGRVTSDAVVLDKASGKVIGQRIAAKSTMSVLTAHGVRDEPVPSGWRDRRVLTPEAAAELARLGVQIEELYGRPMEVEWARHEQRPCVLQTRPISGLGPLAPDTRTEVWNDSIGHDYLWTNSDLGEAVPDVMTPCTWSLVEMFMHGAMESASLPGHRAYGNIGGRFYMNLSMATTLATAFGTRARLDGLEEVFGKLPPGVRIPLVPISRGRVIRELVPRMAAVQLRARRNQRRLPGFLDAAPGRCLALHERIADASDPRDLLHLWREGILPLFVEACHMLEAAGRQGGADLVGVRRRLERLVGEHDAAAMLTGLRHPSHRAAGLGPVTGLAQLARGEIDERAYTRDWGHRGPHEFEVSMPRPAEDPRWAARQLMSARDDGLEAAELVERQQAASRAAWRRFEAHHPRQVAAMRRRVGRYAQAVHDREAARSEVVRVFWVLRAFVLRAGALTEQGDGLFFLTGDEILGVLGEDDRPLRKIPVRRRTYERYRTLPPYPALIRGPFDPFAWARDPDRRTDYYDAARPTTGATPVREWEEGDEGAVVTGFPGAPGIVEGVVRVLSSPEDGDRLRPGEILVTAVTNIGWTPLFPRAAALVTDVGAPLSHAAIVARELGVPAVVGCGDATMLLRTGDHVRVDGERGKITVVADRPHPTPASPRPAASGTARRTEDG
ncbi:MULTISPECIES: PEP/pyruvate-binding domain-containing protein [Thermomonosporaceae]|uniref:PEP/pyruvate-binding domain-containing protein n=1 Tax=Thermomonosporaceae TaxID=2012 RepID=UPI00255A9912|nr:MULTISPECIES: PEP/pyruvate-binding domain-containing protein [Thermomonosporaceae]MDL4772767.1 PEP/pyruvate-binding domain-containing protein [Actinomadura xylanilytica]